MTESKTGFSEKKEQSVNTAAAERHTENPMVVTDPSQVLAEPRTLQAPNANATPEELWEQLKKNYLSYRPAEELADI